MNRPQSRTWLGVLVCLGIAHGPELHAQCPATELIPTPTPGAGDDYGGAVAISGDWAVVGNFREDQPAWGAPGLDAGAVYFAHRAGGIWSPASRVFPASSSPQANGEGFGSAVDIEGVVAVIGAPTFDTSTAVNCGAAYVYRYDGSAWVFETRLFAFDVPGTVNPIGGETFGRSVAISGETIVVGGPQNTGGGRACVYRFNGSSWDHWQRLLHPSGVGGDQFGRAVDVHGNRIVVGAPYDDHSGFTDVGSAVVFEENSGVWSQLGATQTTPFATNYTLFGTSVAISGDTMLAGAPGEFSGQGLVWCHEWNGAGWSAFGFNPAPTTGFGTAVAIYGDIAVGGAPAHDLPGLVDAGEAYVYERTAGVWSANPTAYLQAPAPAAQDWFGSSVSVSGVDVAIGAPGNGSAGAAYVNPVACPPPPPQRPLAFTAPAGFTAGGRSTRVVIADFDADGNLDVAAVDGSTPSVQTVHVYWGDGAGGFDPAVWSDGLTAGPSDVAAADFDDDGYVDLAVASAAGSAIWFFQYTGARAFVHIATYAHPYAPLDLAVGEFTGDCRIDLATANGASNNITLVRNNGGWSFSTQASSTTGTSPIAVAAGDIDADGDTDLAVANSGGRSVVFYRHTGGGLQQAGSSPLLFGSGALWDVALADLDGDGDLDFVVPNPFTGEIVVGYFNDPGFTPAAPTTIIGASNLSAVLTADLDGDNDSDVVVSDTNNPQRLVLLQNYGGGTFAPQTDLAVASITGGIAVGDLDFDGALDLAASRVNGLTLTMNLTDQDCNGNGIPDQAEPLATLSIAVIGPSNGQSCSWEVATPSGLAVGADDNGCAPAGSPSVELAERFTGLVNSAGCPAIRARRVAGWPSLFEIAAPGGGIDLCVGPAGSAPTCCLAASGYCTCNPDLVALSGTDCNANGQDDALDIYDGTSVDLDEDGVPDECETVLIGDVNCDGAVNAFDIDPFVIVLTDVELYAEQFPDCDLARADINQDDAINAFDIDPFVMLLTKR